MGVASGTDVSFGYRTETTHGTPIANAYVAQRLVDRGINLRRDTLESQEITLGRQRADVRHGFGRVEGTLEGELSISTFDNWLLYGMGCSNWSTPATVTHAGVTLSVTGTNTFTRVTGDWLDGGFRPGDWVDSTNFTTPANNGRFRVTSVTATGLTVAGTLTNEAGVAGAQVAYVGSKLLIGAAGTGQGYNLQTMTIERTMNIPGGSPIYSVFKGCAINTLTVSAVPDALVRARFGILGMDADLDQTSSLDSNGYTAAPTNAPLAAIDGATYWGGSTFNSTSFEFTLDNSRTLLPIIGSRISGDVYEGQAVVKGTFTRLLSNTTAPDAFQNETEIDQIQLKLNELGTTNFLSFNFYRVKLTADDIDPPSSGAVIQDLQFEALAKTFNGTANTFREVMHIQRSNS